MSTIDPRPTAVSISHVSKDFRLPHENYNSLKERIFHLGKKVGIDHLHALRGIDFEVKKGEFFGIVGRNGSGKSTLLKIIGGIYQPTKGKVHVNGTLTPFIELGIGFNPELTGRENVFLNGAILGLTRKEIRKKYQEIVDFAELERFMDQKLKNYSSGMQVRLAFSIAIQAHNDILLIDEVLAVGDANFQRKCFRVFREIKKSGKTVIFVTHDMGMVQEFCDRALMIQDSRLVAIGEPRDIALRYEQANSSAGSSADDSGKLKRPKNPAVEILSVTPKLNGKKADRYTLVDTIEADVELRVHRQTEIQVNGYLVKEDGSYLGGINSTKQLPDYCPKVGKHTIRCSIEASQVVKGSYDFGVAIYTWEDVPELIDIIDRAYSSVPPTVTITESSVYQDGQVYLRGKWSNSKG